LALPQKSGTSLKPVIIAASFSANTPGGCDAQPEEMHNATVSDPDVMEFIDTNHETKPQL